jgi:multiple sugar transport system permease protein
MTDVTTAPARPRPRTAVPLRRRGRSNGRRKAVAGYLFVAPFMALFVAMFVAPLAYALYLSLFREQLVGGTVFVGLANYGQAFSDPEFLSGIGRMARFLAFQVPIMLGLALIFALVLDGGRLGAPRLFRLGIFVPYAVPSVVAALMWGYLYGPSFGPFTQIASELDLPPPSFLSSGTMLASLANVVTWEFAGYNMLILYAALRAVPTELYEAAAVDGAGPFRTAWHIKLPLLRPALLLTLIVSVIGTFQLFNEPQILRELAPSVIGRSFTPNLYAYNLAFTDQRLNYAAAISFVLGFVILLVSSLVVFVVSRRRRDA